MIYIMSDIHGDYKRFVKMLKIIQFTKQDTLYILGDVIDRGNENLKMLDYCMGHKNIILIKGNHEYFMQKAIEDPSFREQWWEWDGGETINELDKTPRTKMMEYYRYLKSLPLYQELEYDGEHFFLTHSGYDAQMEHAEENGIIQCRETMDQLSDELRYLMSYDIHTIPAAVRFDQRLIVGHFPTMFLDKKNPGKIYRYTKYIDIDCGNCNRESGGRLGCLAPEIMKVWYL